MFPYLPHRRRLCDAPYQVHPPAAPAAQERKHPVDARQQLRLHIARALPRPRGAGNFAHRLWPGALLPAVSCRPACAVTSTRHGEFGGNTPK